MSDVLLNLIVLRAADLCRSVRFYRALGLEFVSERHGYGPEHFACDLGGVILELYPRTGSESSTGTRLGFRVPSVDRAVDSLREVGAAVLTEPCESRWGRRGVVEDPDGHRVELLEPYST